MWVSFTRLVKFQAMLAALCSKAASGASVGFCVHPGHQKASELPSPSPFGTGWRPGHTGVAAEHTAETGNPRGDEKGCGASCALSLAAMCESLRPSPSFFYPFVHFLLVFCSF